MNHFAPFGPSSPLTARETHCRKRSRMHHTDTTENFPDAKSQSPNGSTGPTSPDGKARSSLNRLTHGCRSERTVLPFEDPAEWDFTLQSWMKSYNPQAHSPEDPTAATLVFEAARAQWIFQRNQQRLDETESGLPPDAIQWTDDHIKRYNNFLRYKTTAERSFYRAFNNLEAYYKRHSDKAAQAEKARAQMAKIQLRWIKEKAAAAERRHCLRQRVEVFTNDAGESATTFAPTNQELAELLAYRAEREEEKYGFPPEQFVTRFVSFFNGIPAVYDWLNPNEIQRHNPVIGIQQFTRQGWLKQVEAENGAATGHLQPYETAILAG
jgi:hypothetical protein